MTNHAISDHADASYRLAAEGNENGTRTLKLWVSALSSSGKLEVFLNDGSVATVINTLPAATGVLENRVYTITFRPAMPYQHVRIKWTQTQAPGATPSRLILQGAALQ